MKDKKIILKVLIAWGAGCVHHMKLFGGRSFGSVCCVQCLMEGISRKQTEMSVIHSIWTLFCGEVDWCKWLY